MSNIKLYINEILPPRVKPPIPPPITPSVQPSVPPPRNNNVFLYQWVSNSKTNYNKSSDITIYNPQIDRSSIIENYLDDDDVLDDYRNFCGCCF